jgi:hypothetical protein
LKKSRQSDIFSVAKRKGVAAVTTEEFIITLFCQVDDRMGKVAKHPQAKLYPSEVVTIGMLFALKGGSFRSFDRWLKRDFASLFAGLPERSRLHRLLLQHRGWTKHFLASAREWLVLDSYAIELSHPVRYRHTARQLGYKLRDKGGRWLIGVRSGWLVNAAGQIVNWGWQPSMWRGDQAFFVLLEVAPASMPVLTDSGFRQAGGIPANVTLCQRGEHNERMVVETVLALLTRVCGLKQLFHRSKAALSARLGYVAALYNSLLQLAWQNTEGRPLAIAQFSL